MSGSSTLRGQGSEAHASQAEHLEGMTFQTRPLWVMGSSVVTYQSHGISEKGDLKEGAFQSKHPKFVVFQTGSHGPVEPSRTSSYSDHNISMSRRVKQCVLGLQGGMQVAEVELCRMAGIPNKLSHSDCVSNKTSGGPGGLTKTSVANCRDMQMAEVELCRMAGIPNKLSQSDGLSNTTSEVPGGLTETSVANCRNMRVAEDELCRMAGYLDNHGKEELPDSYIDAGMRAVALSWMVEVACEFQLHQETLFLATSLVDRFLHASKVLLLGLASSLQDRSTSRFLHYALKLGIGLRPQGCGVSLLNSMNHVL